MQIDTILDAIGGTPLVRLTRMSSGNVLAKAEHLNPGGSVKDRVARYIIDKAEAAGRLREGMTVIEATSGNTGIGITLVGRQKGYRVICVMPENMSEERKKIIAAFGGEMIFTAADASLSGSVARLKEIVDKEPERYFVVNQFANPDNPEVHYTQTAPEIWKDAKGKIDVFVAGVGSGGTLQGIGRFLKEKNPDVKIVAVEPKSSSALLGREPGLHQIQGIGDGFVPAVLDVSLVDDVLEVSDEDAIETTRQLGRDHGLLVGISSGANVWAARQLRRTTAGNIGTVLPDRAERYFSTALL